jgi:hypothetical protein
MAGVNPEEARQFYEEDEDPAKVFAIFDAAKREGRLGRTAPPQSQQHPVPLRVLLAAMAAELRRDLRELQLRDRLALLLEHTARAMRSRNKVG